MIEIEGYVHGIDPASKNDYYADVIHVIPKITRLTDIKTVKPFLIDIFRIRHKAPTDILNLQIRFFNKYPPLRAVIDATREDFLADALCKKYGEPPFIRLNFTNTVKFQLKQIGFSYLDSGYTFPDKFKLQKQFPRFAKLIDLLHTELKSEIVEFGEGDTVRVRHPLGKHNDLVHGWEMSLMGVTDFLKYRLATQKIQLDNPDFAKQKAIEAKKIEEFENLENDEDEPVPYSAFRLPY